MNIFATTFLIAVSLLLTSCAPTPVASPGFKGTIGDAESTRGVVQQYRDSNIVSIGAGWVRIGDFSGWNAWYLIDVVTENCWLKVGTETQGMNCCSLKNVKEAKQFLSFLSSTDCNDAN